jgi:hypothetical protein
VVRLVSMRTLRDGNKMILISLALTETGIEMLTMHFWT